MLSVIIALLLVIGVFLALSFALGRETREVQSARDTEYVELEGVWVRYRMIGSGPPVVLVHGWLSSSRVWESLAEKLAQDFTVYALDLPGFGDSDKPLHGYGLRPGSRLLRAFCAEFGISGAAVVGHDTGGDMAVKLAADHPDLVSKLVLVAAPADADHVDLPTSLWLPTIPVAGPVLYALGRSVRPVRRWWARSLVAETDDPPQQAIEDVGRSTPAAAGKSLKAARRELARGRLLGQARRVKAPLLVIFGEEDPLVDPDAAGVWAEVSPAAEVFSIKGCGHLPMAEEPASFEERVISFLTGDREPASEARPVVYRKRGGSYSVESGARGLLESGEATGNGNRSHPNPAGRNEKTRNFIPELPEDLFEWPDATRRDPAEPHPEPPEDLDDDGTRGETPG